MIFMMAETFVKVVIITGPTAAGKTTLGCKIAGFFDGEIISADSRQVYRGLDLGTGKDLCEYCSNGKKIPYHLIDIRAPNEEYNLRQFNSDAYEKIADISGRDKLPIIVGGSPLYIDSLISSYDFPLASPDYELRKTLRNQSAEELREYIRKNIPEAYEKIGNDGSRPRLIRVIEDFLGAGKKKEADPRQTQKVNCEWLILGAFFDRKEIHSRIEKRLDERIQQGMIEEVNALHASGVSWERLDSFGLEYRYVSIYLRRKISLEEMRNTLLAKIRGFARSQDIW